LSHHRPKFTSRFPEKEILSKPGVSLRKRLAIEGFQALSAGGTISLVHHHRTLALWHILHIKDAHGTTPANQKVKVSDVQALSVMYPIYIYSYHIYDTFKYIEMFLYTPISKGF
jgi:hypothetical protein